MNDLGVEDKYNMGPISTEAEKKGKKRVHYPRESFTTEQMPGLEGAKVGQMVKVTLEAEVVEVSKGSDYMEEDESPKTRVSLKFKKGSCELMAEEPEDDGKTEKQRMQEKEDGFNKSLGIDEEESAE